MMILLLTLISVAAGLRQDPRNEFYNHAIVQPTLYQGVSARKAPNAAKDIIEDEVTTLEFQAFGKNFVVDLKENKDLFSPNYKVILENKAGEEIHKPSEAERRCYYKGHMPNVEDSWAAVSTCHGISGTIFDGKEAYYIEPNHNSRQAEHFVFKASDYKKQSSRCGVEDNAFFKKGSKLQLKSYESAYRGDNGPFYMEIVVICDNSMYKKYNGNTTYVKDRVQSIINGASALLSLVNVFPVLQSTRIWMLEDRFEVSKNAQTTLDNFIKFRTEALLKHEPHDNAIFIAGEKYDNGVAGNAYVGAICGDSSAENVVDYSDVLGLVSSNTAHEIGHNLGSHHDDDGTKCKCVDEICVMFPFMPENPPKHWSSCSKEAFEKARADGKYSCLTDRPMELSSSLCGNGKIDEGEECDCGDPYSCDEDQCCDAITCRKITRGDLCS